MAANDLTSEIERLNWTVAAISKVNRVLVRATSERELFVGACEAITFQDLFALAWIGIPLHDEKKTVERFVSAGSALGYLDGLELTWADNELGGGPTGRAIRTGLIQCNNNMLSSAQFRPWRERAARWNLQSSFSLPIKLSNGEVAASLQVYSHAPDAFGDRELDLLTQLGDDLGFGIDALRTRTAYRAAEQQIHLMGKVLENSAEGIMITDAAHRIVSVNPGFSKMTGYSQDEASGRDPSFLRSERHGAAFFDDMLKTIERQGHWQGEMWHRHREGREFPAWLSVAAVHDSDGNVVHHVGILFDISERRQAEASAQQEKIFSEALLDSMPGVMYFYNEQGRFLRWNHNFQSVTGYSAAEITRMGPLDFIALEDRPIVDERIAEVFSDGESAVQAHLMTKDGRAIPYYLTGKVLRYDDQNCLIGVGIDISRLKQAERSLRDTMLRLQATSRRLLEVQENERRVLARELHDTVGQELTALSLNLSIIRGALPTSATSEVAHKRIEDSQALLEQASAHLRNVMAELRPPGLDDLGLFATLKDHVQRVAQRSGLALTIQGAEPKPRLNAIADIALFRIAQEALHNIVKHAGATRVNVTLEDLPETVVMEVVDDGHGFNPEAPAQGARHGMGMNTMRERAQAIGADLLVESKPGLGCKIRVELPRAVSSMLPASSLAAGLRP